MLAVLWKRGKHLHHDLALLVWAQLVPLHVAVQHLFKLLDLGLNLLIVRIELERSIHLLYSLCVVLGCFVQEGDVDQDIDFIQVLLGFLSLLERLPKKGQCLFHLTTVLAQKHSHVVVWKEGLSVNFKRCLVGFHGLLFVALSLLDDAEVVKDSHLVAKAVLESCQRGHSILSATQFFKGDSVIGASFFVGG